MRSAVTWKVRRAAQTQHGGLLMPGFVSWTVLICMTVTSLKMTWCMGTSVVGGTGDSRWQCTQWPDQCSPYEIPSALFFLSEMDKLPLIFI